MVNQLFAEVDELVGHTQKRVQLKADFATSALARLTASPATETAQEWAILQPHFGTFFNQADNVKKLRESILQLAVQGKLTAKWRTSHPLGGDAEGRGGIEPASKLLERIKTEKAKLVKAGKLKKEKPLPAITEDEIPYTLPEGWVWCRLQELVTLLGDGIHGTPIYTPNGPVHFVNGNNLSDGRIEIKPNTKTVSKEEAKKHYRDLNDRTVLVSINGTIGNTAFYNGEDIMLGKSACYFNLGDGIDKEYIRRVITSNYFLDYAFSSATGTTIKNVSLRSMREFLVPLPPIEEQKAIVQQVNALMALCDKLETEIETRTTTLEDWMKSWVGEVGDKPIV